ncbi:prepilin-type N-terminal cleavage/methylation domain-containing protein [Labrenzia sp. OB1]|uniref:prepilin-type N-terminal cleavage/methylation domain-containing protein n=1 Tax=Labrenzia sp. OB1 TaxID=1561204 RepID=UPI0007B26EE1|nr:prepilin-type N-terminal cleavage/methylation domain-containing protein [Labrenzia sp. OB1]KZM47468.1 hypothetical protein OA90_25710 [Labrenzia sp. OB1]
MPDASANAGFSLTELLVSLLILGLISMAATSALSVGKRIWAKVEAAPDVTLTDAELNHLRRAVALRIAKNDGTGGGVTGSVSKLSFSGLSQTEDGIFEKAQVSLHVTEGGLEVSTEWEGASKSVTLKYVSVAGFGYQARLPTEQWVTDWPATDPAPALVRLTFASAEGEEPETLILKLP